MASTDTPGPSSWAGRIQHPAARAVDEGVLVARSALRLAIKNRVIMATLRDEKPWDDVVMTALARAEIESLIGEMEENAARLETNSAKPIRAFGKPRKVVANLRQDARRQGERATILRSVIAQLRVLEDDPEQTRALLRVARDETLGELTQARLIPLGIELSDDERRISIDAVKEDLAAMLAQRQVAEIPEY